MTTFNINGKIYTEKTSKNGRSTYWVTYEQSERGRVYRVTKDEFEKAFEDYRTYWADDAEVEEYTESMMNEKAESIADMVAAAIVEFENSDEAKENEDRFTSADDVKYYADRHGWSEEIEQCAGDEYDEAVAEVNIDKREKFEEMVFAMITEKVIKGMFPTKPSNPRKSKDVAHEAEGVTLTAKQVDFIKHLPDTCFWEQGLDSCIWVDCLCDDIGGQFKGKPMTVGAMISTLCEKGIGLRSSEKRDGRKCTTFELTELGKKVAAGLGL